MRTDQVMRVLAVLIISSQAYRVNYYDCSKPERMSEYDLRTFCENTEITSEETTTYHVLQKKKNIRMKGYSCQIIRSTFIIHCGMFSHQELLRMPDIEIKQTVEINECQAMVNTGFLRTKEGTKHKVKMGEENVFHVSEKGVLHQNSNKIWCEGESLKINNNIIPGVLKMVQYRTTIEQEDFIVDKKRVEALNTHVRLPAKCGVETGGCVAYKTYLWNPPINDCPLEKINTGKFTKERGWLIEKRAKLLFKVNDRAQNPPGCPTAEILYTEYEDLFLTTTDGFPHVGTSIDISLYVRQSSDYVLYETERLTTNVAENTYQDICQQTYMNSKDEVIPIGDGRFGRRSGDILYTFNCIQKTGKLQSFDRKCFDRLPLQNQIFVDPVTRIGTKHASAKECNSLFPEAILTLEGWIALPELRPIKEPSQFKRTRKNNTHEDMSRAGLYTKAELNQWEQFISYGTFRTSLFSSLSFGACIHKEICQAGEESSIPRYNIDRLIEEAEGRINIFAKINSLIKTYGAYLSLLVLLLWTGKACLWVAMIFTTVIREGKHVAVALLYATCCGTLYKTGRIRRRNNKSAPPEPKEEFKEFSTSLLRPM